MTKEVNALIVDDEKAVRQGMLTMIPWSEYDIKIVGDVNSGAKALDFIASRRVDLLITDMVMPVMSGIELIRKVRELYPALWIVVLSFHQDYEYVREAMHYGVIDYILKTQLERSQMEDFLKRIRSRIDMNGFASGKTDERNEKTFCGDTGYIVAGGQSERLLETLNMKRVLPINRVIEVGNYWLIECGEPDSIPGFGLKLSELFPLSSVIALRGLKDAETQSFIKPLASYIDRYIFYEQPPNGEIHSVHLREILSEPEPDYDGTEHEIRENWSSILWVYKEPGLDGLIDLIQRNRPDSAFLKELFFSLSKSWKQNINHLSIAFNFNFPLHIGHWREWEQWLRDLRDRLRKEIAKPFFSQEVIEGIMSAMDYINNNASLCMKQDDIAKKVGMSRGYFSKCFKEITGLYFNDYVRNVKIEKAKALLAFTNKPVYIISEQIGYLNDKHFSRVFRDLTGTFPTEYRKQIHENMPAKQS